MSASGSRGNHVVAAWIRRKWLSVLTFFQQQHQQQLHLAAEDVTITDERDPDTASQTGSLASERGIDIGRVGSWATDFEKLLTDPIGLRTFVVRSHFFFLMTHPNQCGIQFFWTFSALIYAALV